MVYTAEEYSKVSPKNRSKIWVESSPGQPLLVYKSSPLTREKLRNRLVSEGTRTKISESNRKTWLDRQWYGIVKYVNSLPRPHIPMGKETKAKLSKSVKKAWLDKQWYGSVAYLLGQIYCILFNAEFKERCRAYWGYRSVLPPYKTQSENICRGKPYRLTVHHVYYQPKACCEWDEDLEGYYAMINLGTERKPNMVRHNIKGDPNKFVVLTHSENIKANSNKLEWIKKFEDMIEEQGGKCYLTKEEMKEYKKLGNS